MILNSSRNNLSLPVRAAISAATCGVTALTTLASGASAQQPQQPQPQRAPQIVRPNVVFILADDLGWLDTATYGSKFYKTPNIDKLRSRGMMFTRAYSASPLCSPTRASILTGQYPGRLHLTAPQGHEAEARLTVTMPKSAASDSKVVVAPSISRLPLTYNTLGHSFKNAGYTTGFMGKWHLGSPPYVPENFGFDKVIGGGGFSGPPSYFSPYKMGQFLSDGPPGEHIDERLGNEAIQFLEENQDKPFYLNVWSYDVHAPFQARPEYISEYRNLVDPNNPQKSPIYAAMVKSTDELVGRVTDALDRLKLTEKTLIVFFSDNGGNTYDRVEGIPPTSNAPLRNGKGSTWEGGTRVPMIVSWPGHVAANSTSDALVSSIDFYPTLLDIAGAKGKPDQIMDGVNIRPVLEGTGKLERDTIYCHFPHTIPATQTPASIYVHKGNMKLIRFFADNPDQSDRFELYNLAEDVGETNNLAPKMQAQVGELNALISQHLKETGALVPFANPNYAGPTKEIDGWSAGGTARLQRVADGLQVNSSGNDPWFAVRQLPPSSGPYTLKFRMRSAIDGEGNLFWALRGKGFNPQQRIEFPINSDGQWHEYSVNVKAPDNVQNMRLDPGQDVGEATFDWIRLFDGNNKVVKAWEFAGIPTA